jgi:preprotein translocase subunit SecF
MEIFVNANYNFLKWRIHVIVISLLFILVGFGWFMARGLNVGVDFAGGANVVLRFQDEVPLAELRSRLPDATIQRYGPAADNSVLIRLPKQQTEGDYAGQVVTTLHTTLNPQSGEKLDLNYQGRGAIAEQLKAADPDSRGTGPEAHDHYYNVAQSVINRRSELGIFRNMQEAISAPGVSTASARVIGESSYVGRFNVLNQETVGPQVGRELQRKAIWAIVLSTLAMGLYIAIRFDIKFGVAAVICLMHDVAFTFAFLALVGAEFSLITVAAFLMIIGYSINDTVVIYDRVRENVKKSRVREKFETILNRSLNQTLSRTVLTGGSVMVILLSLILFGGEVIHDFALLLLVGTIIGTLSTLTVVPAVVLFWNARLARTQGAYGGRTAEAPSAPAPTVEPKAARRAR